MYYATTGRGRRRGAIMAPLPRCPVLCGRPRAAHCSALQVSAVQPQAERHAGTRACSTTGSLRCGTRTPGASTVFRGLAYRKAEESIHETTTTSKGSAPLLIRTCCPSTQPPQTPAFFSQASIILSCLPAIRRYLSLSSAPRPMTTSKYFKLQEESSF